MARTFTVYQYDIADATYFAPTKTVVEQWKRADKRAGKASGAIVKLQYSANNGGLAKALNDMISRFGLNER